MFMTATRGFYTRCLQADMQKGAPESALAFLLV
jgi:hypothetical protein